MHPVRRAQWGSHSPVGTLMSASEALVSACGSSSGFTPQPPAFLLPANKPVVLKLGWAFILPGECKKLSMPQSYPWV